MTELHYEKYGLNRQTLIEKVKSAMSEKRFQHVLGVEKAAITLAEIYQGDVTKASLAGLAHDYAKERSDQDFIEKIKAENLDPDLLKWGNNIWHGIVGAYFVAEELGIQDAEIFSAIQKHTTGAANMSLLDKILYVADYIEENRNFPGVLEARKVAFENLDAAVSFETQHTLSYLVEKAAPIYPKSLETYNHYVAKKL